MNTPPFLLLASMACWGWQTGHPFLAAAGACVLEGSRLLPWRWSFPPATVNRAIHLSTLMLGGLLVYSLFTGNKENYAGSLTSPLMGLPVALFPVLFVQVYGIEGKIDFNALFLFRGKGDRAPRLVDGTSLYAVVTLLSAGMANNHREVWFYAVFSLITGWLLWSTRPGKKSLLLRSCLFLLAVVFGYMGHVQLNRLQGKVENAVQNMFVRALQNREPDPFRTKTALGERGSLQLSDEIVMRVKADGTARKSFLLREAGYNMLALTTWISRDGGYWSVPAGRNNRTWDLANGPEKQESMRISLDLPDGKGLLPLPRGATRIEDLPAEALKLTASGAVAVDQGPEFADFLVRYGPGGGNAGEYTETDLRVPRAEAAVIGSIVHDLRIKGRPVPQVLDAVKAYFQNTFRYSTYNAGNDDKTDALAEFLTASRAGHCEYFATATVLILRSAGIPARYATGYSVQEFSPWEDAYIVRGRHAHAWTEVYHDGAWHDFDTTPASWFATEQEQRSALRGLADLWSWSLFRLSQWKAAPGHALSGTHLLWPIAAAAIILAARLYFTKRVSAASKNTAALSRQGEDSEFYGLEMKLTTLGFSRNPWEPLSSWLRRIEKDALLRPCADDLRLIVALHYQYRFDPHGIGIEGRKNLTTAVNKVQEAILRKPGRG